MITGRKVFLGSCFLVFLIVIFFQNMFLSNVDRSIKKISLHDRLVLSDFFCELIENNCFGYTLFGSKPVSFESYFIKTPHSILDFLRDRNSYMIHRGQKMWMKHKDLFEFKNFILKFEIERGIGYIYLINKSAFLSCVSTHLDMFRTVLGSHITPKILLNSIIKDGMSMDSLVNNNSILEGLLLGYGKHNSLLHARYVKISGALKSSISPPWKEKKDLGVEHLSMENRLRAYMNKQQKMNPSEGISQVIPGEDFASLAEEYEWIQAKFDKGESLCPFKDLSRFSFPNFLIDAESEESRKIITDYLDTKKKMGETYFSGDFLTITLKKLAGEL